MPVVKKRNQQTETRLLLESDDPVELPPAEVDERAVVFQFETFREHLPELLEELRRGTVAEPVPVMMDGSTFVVHGATRSFWVKLWHSSPERARIERAHVVSCLPSMRGVQVVFDDPDDDLDEEDDDLDDEAELDAGDAADYPDEGEEDDDEDD
ncbi:MAG TPA: hypothetical protein VJ715_07825, partial [Pyrinomonadaceae bacterium]|nr:hypothetical protein [Pyrinomonadaceae bacterium]